MTQIKIQTVPVFRKSLFRKYSSVGVLVDENTRPLCYNLIRKQLPAHLVIEVPAGEEHKNLSTCQFIWQRLTEHHFDRDSLLLVLGGGVLGDMGGFCAATFKRGIDFLLVPTTLLAQVDASIGGKLGIDFGPLKNHVGLFQGPAATFIAADFLKTLPARELRSGFAEVVKHCLVSDKKMWGVIRKKDVRQQDWLRLVRHSVQFKTRVVKKDPKEKGLRKILNFGHTMGHALEGYYLHSGLSLFHGEAIAAGMILEAHISQRKNLLTLAELAAISDYILSVFGKIDLPERGSLMPILAQDKKNRGNTIRMALLHGIGKAVWDVPVSEKEIRDSIEFYQSVQT